MSNMDFIWKKFAPPAPGEVKKNIDLGKLRRHYDMTNWSLGSIRAKGFQSKLVGGYPSEK